MVFDAIAGLGKAVIDSVSGWIQRKQRIQEAIAANKIRLAETEQAYNHEWEMKQLDNAGWKDDILFYAIIGMFVWSGFDPDGARQVFAAWQDMPEWYLNIVGWLVASVLGVKKVGDYLPGLISGVKGAISGKQPGQDQG